MQPSVHASSAAMQDFYDDDPVAAMPCVIKPAEAQHNSREARINLTINAMVARVVEFKEMQHNRSEIKAVGEEFHKLRK